MCLRRIAEKREDAAGGRACAAPARAGRCLAVAMAAVVCLEMASGLASCNSGSTSSEDDYATDVTMTACTGFSLKADTKVCPNLDSVFFSIDLTKGVIFNADSLPMGSKITKLVPVITYPSNVSAVTLSYTGEEGEKTVNYLETATDSIDFSSPVKLTVTAEDGVNSRTYDIKVNVHKLNPDSLVWTATGVADIPSVGFSTNQRTVLFKDRIHTFIKEVPGGKKLATTSAVASEQWQIERLTTPHSIDIRTITATADALYGLDNSGNLLTSTDGLSWNDTGADWSRILGGYGTTLLGLRDDNGTLRHTSYPAGAPETAVESRFPVSGASNMVCFSSIWSPEPIGVIAGGRMADGTLSGSAWGYDGQAWAELTTNHFEPVEEATLVPYFVTRKSSWLWYRYEDSALMLIGGRDAAGKPTRNLWYSVNNGIIWSAASEEARLPEEVPASYSLDGLVLATPMSGSLTDSWSAASRPRRLDYKVEGYDVSWECPYIYLFGGIGDDGKLISGIRRGVLARLTFMPML